MEILYSLLLSIAIALKSLLFGPKRYLAFNASDGHRHFLHVFHNGLVHPEEREGPVHGLMGPPCNTYTIMRWKENTFHGRGTKEEGLGEIVFKDHVTCTEPSPFRIM